MTTPAVATYSGDPAASDLDEVRFLIQDTDVNAPLLTDVELRYLIAKWGALYQSNLYVAVAAALAVAAKYAGITDISADGVSVSSANLSQQYRELSASLLTQFNAEGAVGGEIDITNLLADSSYDYTIDPLEFSMRLDDNPRAGRQNYGGYTRDMINVSYDEVMWEQLA
jgi:hypothetical protein